MESFLALSNSSFFNTSPQGRLTDCSKTDKSNARSVKFPPDARRVPL
jgi:hypothetical protein